MISRETAHPFYRPLWRRVVIVAITAAWLAYEALFAREPMWMMIAGGLFGYAVWAFLIAYKPPPDDNAPTA